MLSVVMPVYNVEAFVAEAVQSVLAQTHRDFVLYVCDDGSKDRTVEVVRAIAARDARVQVIAHANMGIANTMNAAIALCDTEWIACMHGDDVMLPNRLERQLAFVQQHSDVAIVSSLVDWIDTEGKPVGRCRSDLTTPAGVRKKLDAGEMVAFPHPAVMFKKSVIQAVGGYKQEFWPAEDTELWNRAAYAGHGVLVQPEVLLKYRLHASSASWSKAGLMIRKIRWMERCIAAWRAKESPPTWDEFLRWQRERGMLPRLNEGRKEWGRTLYQTAIGHYTAKRFHRFVPSLLGAAMLEPGLVFERVMPRLMGKATAST